MPTATQSDDAPNAREDVTQISPQGANLHYHINPSGDENWFRFYLEQTGSQL